MTRRKNITFDDNHQRLINAVRIPHAFIVYTNSDTTMTVREDTKTLVITKKASTIEKATGGFNPDYIVRVEKLDVSAVIIKEE